MEVDERLHQPQRSGGGIAGGPWDSVLQLTKLAQDKNTDPYIWAVEISARLNSAGLSSPSKELAEVLVSHICWDNFVPNAWKFLERAMCVNLVPPPLVLALLSDRTIPARRCYPGAYRLYMELLRIYAVKSLTHGSNLEEIAKSIDDVLHLSQFFDIRVHEPGILLVLWIFSVVSQLLDASLDDERLLDLTPNKQSRWLTENQVMEIDDRDSSKQNKSDLCERNTVMAIEVIEEFFKNKATSRILFLARQNWRSEWTDFVRRLELLASKSSSTKNSKHVTADILLHTISDTSRILPWQCKTRVQQEFHAVLASGSLIPSVGQSHGASRSGLWIPIDLYLENAMDGLIVTATSVVDTLTDIVKSLHAVNGTTWYDTFSGVWIAVLRLIQREKHPTEGPEPRLDTCLSLLLSVTILAVVNIIEEEESTLSKDSGYKSELPNWDKGPEAKRRTELISSLQSLGQYGALLTPPPAVASVANQASAKAMMYLSGINTGSGYFDCVSVNDMPLNCSGNMWHLIVEACIAREVLDTSAYMWPGYVNARSSQIPNNVAGLVSSWSSFMKGAPLTPSLVTALASTPASSLAEIEKLLEIAVDGSSDDKTNAATVLCGASLVRGWNVQEHVVLSITRLLSPSRPVDYAENDSYLTNYAPFLNILLLEISTSDSIQIFSLYGLVPQLAGVLMPICEVFGSCSPKESWTLATGEKINSHAVFSNAFTLLLKLWRFDHPPAEHVMGSVPRSQLTPDYLLMVRNCQLNFPSDSAKGKKKLSKLDSLPPLEPVFIDSFPKLKGWYMQHQACIASTLSGLAPGNPVHQIVEGLLTMLFKKISRGAQTTVSGTSSTSSGSAAEELCLRLQLAAWDILEAIPFVLDAALTACAYENLSPRELAIGLKDLADFLPASLASIVSYLSAEVSRGVWKPACMNGTEWPSPAAYLPTLEQQLKKLLAATGIDVPSLAIAKSGNPTLPLPLAALLSLTITYKLDKASLRFLNLVGRSAIKLSIECPWPCMPIVASLWAQKSRRWSDFLVFSASRTVFHHNTDAVVRLLRSCFVSTLGLDPHPRVATGGVNALLGHGVGSHKNGGMSPVAPGIFYLRVFPSIRDLLFINEEILSILVISVKDVACGGLHFASQENNLERAKERKKLSKYGPRYGQVSLSAAMARVKLASSLGATLVWITGRASLVHALLTQTLPSWFISGNGGTVESEMVAVLRGYALAYFAVLSGAFAWGIDKVRLKSSTATRQRSKVLGDHLKFVVAALDGKISLGCDWATWRAYVSGLVGLMVGCTQAWVKEMELDVLKSLSNGLRSWGEDDLALALLGSGGYQAVLPAVEMIIDGGL